MKHYGAEPPWAGRSRYGSWRRGLETWDGQLEWIYVDPPAGYGTALHWISEVMLSHYLPAAQEALNQESILLKHLAVHGQAQFLEGQQVDVMTASSPTPIASGRIQHSWCEDSR